MTSAVAGNPPVAKQGKRLENVDESQSERIEVRCRPSEKKRWDTMVRRKGIGSLSALARIAMNEYCDRQEQED
jgi:hypothetical protein